MLTLLFGYALQLPTYALSIPTAAAMGLWMYRYFKGYRVEPEASAPAQRTAAQVCRAAVSSVERVCCTDRWD